MLRFDDVNRTLELSVHDVVDAGPPAGHLSMMLAWSGRARLAAGQAVHSRWQESRAAEDPDFAREVQVRHRLMVGDWEVVIAGRIDGLSREGDHWIVEEVKSSALDRGRLERLCVEDLPHAALQLRLYLHVLAARGQRAEGRLVLVSLADGSQRVLQVHADPSMDAFLQRQLGFVIAAREEQLGWYARRRTAVVPMAHDTWRPGQELLASEVEEAVHRDGHLLLTAPTGLGKTAAVLYGALRVAYQTDRRVFFATARTTQQRIVEDTLRAMAAAGLPLRAVSIRARDKVCLNEVVACRPDCCRFADGHHDKVREGKLVERLWAEKEGVTAIPSPDDIVAMADSATACPFALSVELAGRADVIVGDYNYVFDPHRRLGPLGSNPEDWIVIVDEAHNLPDRAMGYASPALPRSMVIDAIDGLASHPDYAPCVEAARDVLDFIDGGIDLLDGAPEFAFALEDGLVARDVDVLATRFDELAIDYALLRHEQPVFAHGDPWLDLARVIGRLRMVIERAGEETVAIWRGPGAEQGAGLKLLCRDSAPVLRPLFDGIAGSVSMSATLEPVDFYRSMLGLASNRTVDTQHGSPFPPDHRRVVIVPDVSTEYRKRAQDNAAIAAHVERAVAAVPGNVAVFFSSFALRDAVCAEVDLGDRPVIVQQRSMDESARADVLQTLLEGGNHVLLGVLGGIFAEGIDLPGDALLAVVVVGPALPAVGLERRLMSAWYQERYDDGFRYAYQVPGMARVVQAAGRVIRTSTDKGAIVLVGRRFLQRSYQAFFPEDWAPIRSVDPDRALDGLWDAVVPESLGH